MEGSGPVKFGEVGNEKFRRAQRFFERFLFANDEPKDEKKI